MSEKIILLISLTFWTSSFSQSISKQVIGATGKTQTNGNVKLSYTIGEPIVGLMTAGGNQLGNGYWPSLDLQALSIEDNTLYMQIRVYPNPTSQALYITHPELSTFLITIDDMNGKQLYQGTINKEEPLDVSNYANGTYLVTIEYTSTNKKNTYKIIKK